MQRKLSLFLSYLLHPLLMPTAGCLLVFNLDPYLSLLPYSACKITLFIIALGTIILPLCFFPLYRLFHIIQSPYMRSRQERLLPLVITAIMFSMTYSFLSRMYAPDTIRLFMLACSFSVTATLVVSYFWKISAHLIGIGGIMGLLLFFFIYKSIYNTALLALATACSGLLAYARLYMQEHTPAQVYTGLLVGMGSVFMVMRFVYYA